VSGTEAIDWYGISAVIAAVFSGIAAVLAVLLARPINATNRQVKTSNGTTLGEAVEATAKHVGVVDGDHADAG
jgi:hypothetical protein